MTTIEPLAALAPSVERRTTLVDRINGGESYALAFGGQGVPWLDPFAELVRDFALEGDLSALLSEAKERLAPVAAELARVDAPFDPLTWANLLAIAASAEDTDAADVPGADILASAAVSVPGILLTQLAGLRALRKQGIDPQLMPPVATISHSQGRLAKASVEGVDDAELLAIARLIGAASTIVGRRRNLLGETMLSISNTTPEKIEGILAAMPPATVAVVGVRNARRTVVVSGSPESLKDLQARCEEIAVAEKAELDRKVRGGSAFAPIFETLNAQVAFHHPALAEAADLVAEWASVCGLDADRARALTSESIVEPVEWVKALDDAVDAGASWILDLGPADLVTRMSVKDLRGRSAIILAPTTRRGHRELTSAGAAPKRKQPWSAYAPKVVALPDGQLRVETRFTKLTGRSPVLLAGMTPTTVDAKIVAAAANAGFWAELAGGGQVNEEIFADRIAELGDLLEPGRSYQFNTLFLDPYLWKLQVGQKRLVQRARAAGAAIDGVIVTAGVPEFDDAVALVAELREADITHVVFKPGTAKQIKSVIQIAKEVAPTPIIVQIEGGKAGGHHSWEDLDELLIATYADLRECENIVVCVGGGIGTPETASNYLTGAWALKFGYPSMPLDGILVGTAAMATLEATTSPAVKQLLVDTRGTNNWVGAGQASGGMVSGRSQLGADIHEIDNTASRCGLLLDDVAGDADAVADRRDEIIGALNATAKPYFGDVESMTYAAWLDRFVELAGQPVWLDTTQRDRFHGMIQQAEARLNAADKGSIATLFAEASSVDDGPAALRKLVDAYPHAEGVVVHPADVPFFVDLCRTPGKPVNFVPVLDADVRRWWRSDSLWQAHDERYSADQVCIIPGPVAVAGIERVDEPVAELLQRFEDLTIDGLLASGDAPMSVSGRRRVASAGQQLSLVLAAPDVQWAGRMTRNPIHRLGTDWVIVDDNNAENPETGASVIIAEDNTAVLTVPLTATPSERQLTLTINLDDAVSTGGAPVITTDDAADAMTMLLSGAAGGTLPVVVDGVATLNVDWNADLIADHQGVTTALGSEKPKHPVPDVLVGLSWPAVFATLGDVTAADGTPVIEGMLDLVHLDHAIHLLAPLPSEATTLTIGATASSASETDMGRVVTVDVTVNDGDEAVATLTERFAIRGRNGAAKLDDPKRAGGAVGDDLVETPRRSRASAKVAAPSDMGAFATVSGDHNPIHTSIAAARLAGLGEPIVHGMWLSAAAQQVTANRRITGWTTRFLAPLSPGATVDIRADRVALDNGDEIVEVTCRADGELVMAASARLEAPRTAYAFPGQGIQSKGMGMAGYGRSKAARDVWDRADAHTRQALGFSILTVVRDNPTVLKANGTTHRHPDGVLFLTQFTQAAMATLGAAQMAELRESGNFVEGSILCGHSVGEYNALAAVSGVIPLEAVVEVVFQRGSVMHALVPRDSQGRSNYRLAAIRPSQLGLDDDAVPAFVAGVAEKTGEFLEIVNFNLRGSQYAIAGTVAGLEALEKAVNKARDEFGGRGAYVLVPGIDVPFHSTVLRGGVPDFRLRLEDLLPAEIDPEILTGRYIPNLVPKPFSLEREFVQEIADLVPSEPLNAVLADFDVWTAKPSELCRTLLIELLAWQFASPVRWIETQDLLFGPDIDVERFIEIGVGGAPTVANLATSTLKLPGFDASAVQVLNIERDSAAVFSTDEEPAPIEDEAPAASDAPAEASAPVVSAAPVASSGGPRPADLSFDAADATQILVAMWTKLRIDQIGTADSIESLCDGVSSRRNQLLVDLGGELSLGAIDGAAEADMRTLADTVNRLGRGYKPFGPVLAEAIADGLRKVLGPTGRRQSSIAERVTDVWQLGAGWANHVTAEFAMSSREGASVRGGAFGETVIATGADVDAAIDAAVSAVAARRGVSVDLPVAAGGDSTVDAAALGEITAQITGPDGVLASTARHLLNELNLVVPTEAVVGDDADAIVLERVAAELGSDWARLTAPAFDAKRAVLIDDRWATAREDLASLWVGNDITASFEAAGDTVAAQAIWWAERARTEGKAELAARYEAIAEEAVTEAFGEWSDDIAVVTGASKGSIASGIVAKLLAGGATVIATTSGLDQDRLKFYRSLYRDNARMGASLWVVPANMASFSDVDSLSDWVCNEQADNLGGKKVVTKSAMTPTLLFPFAAGRVAGDMTDAGARAEVDMRILLWSVERLIGALAEHGQDVDIDAVLHVVLPGSPNRGMFGGDGAYGEAKAALDAIVTKWHAEESWKDRVSLAHAIIGWVKGTGLMGQNDPLVDAVEEAGVRTWTTAEMASNVLSGCSVDARISAQNEPLTLDFTGGLAGVKLDMRALAADVVLPKAEVVDETGTIPALPASPAQYQLPAAVDWNSVDATLEDLVVIVGAGELGPYGSSRTRFEMEVSDELSAAGVLELAWTTGLVTWENEPKAGWYDVESGD
ncbi:MAG: fatty acid synthase subunit beta domain-containing protein, partial [Aeromicrobium sp.]